MAAETSIQAVLGKLDCLANPKVREAMARFAVPTDRALGIPVPVLQKLARELGHNHRLAQQLWHSRIHEARHLAAMIEQPELVTERQLERWVKDFDSWDVTDGCCFNLIAKTRFAWPKAREWSGRREEFVKRAGFALMAALAVHDKGAPDTRFRACLPLIERQAGDDRNFVKKAVNWALRQIGKRNSRLNRAAIASARRIRKQETRAARWIAADALRELESDAVQRRLRAEKSSRL
ncbi:MAG: DNA alkylation repair protein [Acidobacteria bacterium]|nr:MAG: DNA alkylation repair protein [Acidobacteriota bacterium]